MYGRSTHSVSASACSIVPKVIWNGRNSKRGPISSKVISPFSTFFWYLSEVQHNNVKKTIKATATFISCSHYSSALMFKNNRHMATFISCKAQIAEKHERQEWTDCISYAAVVSLMKSCIWRRKEQGYRQRHRNTASVHFIFTFRQQQQQQQQQQQRP